MSEPTRGGLRADNDIVRLDDGVMHVIVDGDPGAPAIVLVHGSGGSVGWWDAIVADLTASHRVIRVDLLGHGRSSVAKGGYGMPAQAHRIGAVLDSLGITAASAVGHSMGSLVVTALAEGRPDLVDRVAVIDMGPDMRAEAPDGVGIRVLSTPVVGRIVWGLRTEGLIGKAMASAVARPVGLPRELILATMQMSYGAFIGTARAARNFLDERDLPSRLAPLGIPLLVIFGAEDSRWRAASADAYSAVPGARVELLPGVGHTPMLEAPETTVRLLTEFVDGRTAVE